MKNGCFYRCRERRKIAFGGGSWGRWSRLLFAKKRGRGDKGGGRATVHFSEKEGEMAQMKRRNRRSGRFKQLPHATKNRSWGREG